MIVAWRIDKQRHAATGFTGEGARLYGGRWNHRGTAIVYTSESLALAALEKLVHLQSAARRYRYIATPVEIPVRVVRTLSLKTLPRDWCEHRALGVTRDIGSRWAAQQGSVVLRVPSVLIPGLFNYLINPLHKNFKRLSIGAGRPFSFDPRLWKWPPPASSVRFLLSLPS